MPPSGSPASSMGSRAAPTPLPGEHDLNFRLEADGARYVLKVHAPRPDLALEDAVLEHLRDEPAVPRLAGPTGAHDGRTVRLLSWLDGRPWADARGDLAEPRPHGRARGPRARATSSTRRCAATTAGTCATRGEHGIDVPALDDLPHQVIHNDANEHNVLVADDGTVAGLIDFGDVVWSARVCGLAVAGAYAMQGQRRPGARGRARSCAATTRSRRCARTSSRSLFELMRARLRAERRDGRASSTPPRRTTTTC